MMTKCNAEAWKLTQLGIDKEYAYLMLTNNSTPFILLRESFIVDFLQLEHAFRFSRLLDSAY